MIENANEMVNVLQLLLNGLKEATFILDVNGNVLFANNAVLDMYKCSREEYNVKYSNIYNLEKRGILVNCSYRILLKRKETVTCWEKVYDKNGNSKLYFTWISPIFNSDGELEYAFGQSISEKAIREKQLLMDAASLADNEIYLTGSKKKKSFIYKSEEMKNLVYNAEVLATTNANILISGETGVGKEVLANYIHNKSGCNKDMIFVNCAAISQHLFESEMFGYSKGAFTGSDPKGKVGLIESANGSTLFLDEVESLPLEQQGKLLRVIETQSITKVGDTQPISVNFRLITATNENLEELVRKGEFRKDLYYRLNVFLLNIPPLRERKTDIRPLTDYFFEKYCEKYNVVKSCSEEAYRQLEEYSWPGNIRELKNLIERNVLMTGFATETINKFALSFFDEGILYNNMPKKVINEKKTDRIRLNEQIEKLEKDVIEKTLLNCKTDSEAAEILGISEATMSRKIKKYNIR